MSRIDYALAGDGVKPVALAGSWELSDYTAIRRLMAVNHRKDAAGYRNAMEWPQP